MFIGKEEFLDDFFVGVYHQGTASNNAWLKRIS
jgi:hypothetical protein